MSGPLARIIVSQPEPTVLSQSFVERDWHGPLPDSTEHEASYYSIVGTGILQSAMSPESGTIQPQLVREAVCETDSAQPTFWLVSGLVQEVIQLHRLLAKYHQQQSVLEHFRHIAIQANQMA